LVEVPVGFLVGVALVYAFDLFVNRSINPRPRHSTIGYLSPVEFEDEAIIA
jgi:hypothetical protein